MDLNYSELKIDTLPTGEYSVVWYNNINQYPSKQRDYYVKLILQNLSTQELKIIDRNIKEIPALALGSIFRDKQLSGDRLFLNKQGKSPMVLRNSLKMVFSLKTSPHISSTSHEINFRDLKAA